jgi:hypothetical protein
MINVTVIVFGFLILISILIIVIISYCHIRKTFALNPNTLKARNLLVSVAKHLSGGQSNVPLHITDSSSDIVIAETNKHRLVMLPTYHTSRDQVLKFLKNPKRPNDIYVVADGEPNPIPRDKKVDIIITTKRDENPHDIYIPYYVLYAQQYQKQIGTLFEPTVPYRTSFDEWQTRSFAVFAYSNDNTTRYTGCANRSLFYQLMLKKIGSRVHNLGKQCSNNKILTTDNKKNENGDYYYYNDDLYKKYKFVIAFENCQIRGYISEKMINPLLGGAIPIYLGSNDVNDHINPDCFINVAKYASFEDCIDDIVALEQDTKRVMKMLNATPFLHDTYLDYMKLKGGQLWPHLLNTPLGYLIPIIRTIPNRVIFLTFGYASNTNTKRIQQEASTSAYFDDIICLGTENVPYDFLEKHQDFIKQNPRDYGLGIFTSTLIQKKLQTMCENDILVFCEPHVSIQHGKGLEILEKQYQALIQSEKGVLAFETDDVERHFTKKQCLDTLCEHQLHEKENIANSFQVGSNYIVLKKCLRTMLFVARWVFLSSQYPLLDMTVGKEHKKFVEHRNAQSIFSCLMKLENELILLKQKE